MDYKSVASSESFGKYSIGIRILVAIDREFTEEEKRYFSEVRDKMLKQLFLSSLLADPDEQRQISEDECRLLALFPDKIYVKKLPNGYSDSYVNPWYQVWTAKGPITIGWRRRVIQIDWKESDIKSLSQELFSGEDVTKFDQTIHAWGYEKAGEYISKILNA